MESIDIITGQHVAIKYRPANVLQRGGAIVVDFLILSLYAYLLFYLFDNVFFYSSIDNILTFILYLPVIGYHLLFEVFLNGKTPGKMLLGIRVVKKDGSIPGISSYILRWLFLFIDILFMGAIGFISILITKHHQRLGDIAAGTIVVRNAKPKKLSLETDFIEFSTKYKPTFGLEVERLTTGQIRFISDILYEPFDRNSMQEQLKSLAEKVKKITELQSTMNDRRFLETVVRDYNYFAWHGI